MRDSIDIYNESAKNVIKALNKVDEWTDVARLEGITGRRIEKRATCFPEKNVQEKKPVLVLRKLFFKFMKMDLHLEKSKETREGLVRL